VDVQSIPVEAGLLLVGQGVACRSKCKRWYGLDLALGLTHFWMDPVENAHHVVFVLSCVCKRYILLTNRSGCTF
jgi:hypothetical protein